ncbi:hypothetical protein [Candidatus Palauibacter sp.]
MRLPREVDSPRYEEIRRVAPPALDQPHGMVPAPRRLQLYAA